MGWVWGAELWPPPQHHLPRSGWANAGRGMGSPWEGFQAGASGVSPHPTWDVGRESQRTCGWGEAVSPRATNPYGNFS